MNATCLLSTFLCQTKAKNNEEYRVVLKKQRFTMVLLLLLGLGTIAVTYAVTALNPELLAETNDAFLYGFGSGLFAGALIRILQIVRILKNEALLKQERLKATDEREQEITNRALRMTAKILALTLYLFIIICTFVEIRALDLLTFLLLFVLFCYILCRKILEKLM